MASLLRKHFEIGRKSDSGICLGEWIPLGTDGRHLGIKLRVFAGPTDLDVIDLYPQAAHQVANLKMWHGHNGAYYENEQALIQSLVDGKGLGTWFIPGTILLNGTDAQGRIIRNENLLDLQDRRDFRKTFLRSDTVAVAHSIPSLIEGKRSPHSFLYLSSTDHPSDPSYVRAVNFLNRAKPRFYARIQKTLVPARVRPCRAELVARFSL